MIRIIHIFGGLRSVNNFQDLSVILVPNTIDNKTVKFSIADPKFLLVALKSLKLRPFGIDYYHSPEEVKGKYPPEWHSLARAESPNYPLNDSIRAWSNISFSARQNKDYLLSDVARRISFEFRACEIRLRDISESYHKELCVLSENDEFENGKLFQTPNSFNIYLAIHSFLVEACSLRDYMAEFIGLFVFQKHQNEQISTMGMGTLRKKILKKLHEDDVFANELYQATDPNSPDGWLANLGEYRDLIVHCMPLTQARGASSFLIQKQFDISSGQHLPSIGFPLPDDPSKISKEKTQGIYFWDSEEWLRAFREDVKKNKNFLDALEYCCSINEKMIALSTKLIAYSPIKSEIPIIKLEDIISSNF